MRTLEQLQFSCCSDSHRLHFNWRLLLLVCIYNFTSDFWIHKKMNHFFIGDIWDFSLFFFRLVTWIVVFIAFGANSQGPNALFPRGSLVLFYFSHSVSHCIPKHRRWPTVYAYKTQQRTTLGEEKSNEKRNPKWIIYS